MRFLYSLTMVFLVLLAVALIVIIALYRFNKKRIARNKTMISDWQMQNSYMDRTLEFCTKATEITAEVRSIIKKQTERSYGADCIEKCRHLLNYIHGGNTAAEVLLLHKKLFCDSHGIRFIDEIKILPTTESFPEMDMVSIIGNLLDNAIEASQLADSYDPFVEISSTINKNVWLIRVINTKSPLLTPKDSNMATTKEDCQNHGLGINILQSLVAKYNGSLKTADFGDRFEVTAFLTLKLKLREA